jgi:hypothetical protein
MQKRQHVSLFRAAGSSLRCALFGCCDDSLEVA